MFQPSDFKVHDTMQVISNHKTGGGFWFSGVVTCEIEAEADDIARNYTRGDLSYRCSEQISEIADWMVSQFGEEWDRWHIKMIAPPQAGTPADTRNLYTRRNSVTGEIIRVRKIHTEIFVVHKADFALFKLTWAA